MASKSSGVLQVSLAVIGLSACVVQSGPAPASAPPAAPAAAPAAPPAPVATPAAATAPAPEPLPAQPTFSPTPEPAEKPVEHPHGIARGAPRGLHAGQPEALWVWHDENGRQWHVRSTTHSQEHKFSGRVWVSEGSIAEVHASRIEFNDRVRLAGRSVEFDFHTRGGIDGFDFATSGPQCVHFALFVDGRGEPGRVNVGAGDAHPRHHVFTACP